MKKIIFSILALILFACASPQMTIAPEVTVTLPPPITLTVTPSFTETPIFTLTPTLTADQQVYMDAANELFEQAGVTDLNAYVLKMDGGAVVGYDAVTGKEVFRDGKFDLRYAVENVKDPMPKPEYKPRPYSEMGSNNRPQTSIFPDYLADVFMRVIPGLPEGVYTGKGGSTVLMIDPDKLAYGIVWRADDTDINSPYYLIYERDDTNVTYVPIKAVTGVEVLKFWDEVK